MARLFARENKTDQRVRVLQVGFVGLVVLVVGYMCLNMMKPVESATSPGTCLPVDKGGTGCDTLPVALGGTGGTTPLDARANLGFANLGLEQIIDTDMDGLQATIDSLPKFLANDVMIRVSPGEIAGDIIIERFIGMGRLNIRAVDSSGNEVATTNVLTHKARSFTIRDNSIASEIRFYGFTATATDRTSFRIEANSSYVVVHICNAVAGSSSTAANIGVHVFNNSSGGVNLNTVTLSNKYYAVVATRGHVEASSVNGTGNNIAYRSEIMSTIQEYNDGGISGTNKYSRSTGGVIFDPNGNQRGNGVNSTTLTYAGCDFLFTRKGSTVQIQSSYGTNNTFTSAVTPGQLLFNVPEGLRPQIGMYVMLHEYTGIHYRFLFEANGNFSASPQTSIPSGTSMPDTVTVLAGV